MRPLFGDLVMANPELATLIRKILFEFGTFVKEGLG